MSGPAPLPLIPMPDWLSEVQAALMSASHDLAALTTLQGIANGINPKAGRVNCGWNIDAALDRFTGADPNATSDTARDGSWKVIEQRHATTFAWNSSFADAFAAVQAGGPGTAALIGIKYGGGNAHVVAIVNQGGVVGIIEGQDAGNSRPRGVITDVNRANQIYNGDNKSNIGFGIVGAGAPTP